MSVKQAQFSRYLCEECEPIPSTESVDEPAPASPGRAILSLFRRSLSLPRPASRGEDRSAQSD